MHHTARVSLQEHRLLLGAPSIGSGQKSVARKCVAADHRDQPEVFEHSLSGLEQTGVERAGRGDQADPVPVFQQAWF
jgi:hypothetical protein